MNRLPSLLAPSALPPSANVSYGLAPSALVSSLSSCSKRASSENISAANADAYLPIEPYHRIYYPRNYTPSYDYPLVIWMHSDASSELEVETVMEALSDQNYLAVAPRANVRCQTKKRLYRWGDTRTDYAYAEDAVWDCIMGALECLPVASDRVFIAGFGRGGTLAQWIGLQYAERIAGVVSLSGAAPTIGGALSNWKLAKDLPLLFTQRKGSTICSEEDLNLAMQMAHRAGLNYTFCQLMSEEDKYAEGDELSTAMLESANRFMMGIVTGTPISLHPEASRDHLIGPFGLN